MRRTGSPKSCAAWSRIWPSSPARAWPSSRRSSPAGAGRRADRLAPSPAEDGDEGAGEDLKVEPERSVLDVVEVVFELARDLGDRARVTAFDLRPARQPWLHQEPRTEVGDLG